MSGRMLARKLAPRDRKVEEEGGCHANLLLRSRTSGSTCTEVQRIEKRFFLPTAHLFILSPLFSMLMFALIEANYRGV